MDGIAVWLLFLVCLPFFLFFWKMLLMAWKSILLTKKVKNFSDEIEVINPTLIVYPNDSYSDTKSYAVYAYFVGVLVLVFIALVVKISLNRKKIQSRNVANRQTRARQNQIPTVSHSIDVNRNNAYNGRSTSRRVSEETLKIDLPPTYEEVMKNFLNAKEAVATAALSTDIVASEPRNAHGIVEVEIETISTSLRSQ